MMKRNWMRSLAPVVLCVLLCSTTACGVSWTNLEDFPCPDTGTTLTYENFAKNFLAAYCNSCHAADSKERRGAPIAYVFDTYEAVHALRNRIFLRSAADNITMPPGPDDPPKEARDKLAEWIACGAPK